MKNVFKIFEFSNVDVLAACTYNGEDEMYQITFTIRVGSVGNSVDLSLGFESEEIMHRNFEQLTQDGVKNIMSGIFSMADIEV